MPRSPKPESNAMPNLPRPAQTPDLAPHPVPTLCDTCRATGTAGASPFEDLAGLLDFTPVPVRSHANNWTPEHQRAFVAALAVTGTEREAARSIGRYAAGADRLRKLPRGKSFADACQNALDLYRERELAGLDAAMVKLDEQARAARAHRKDVFATIDYHRERAPEPHALPDEEQVAAARASIAGKLHRARLLFLESIADDPARRAAWELLCGPTDWDALEAEDAYWSAPPDDAPTPNMRRPDMVVSNAGMVALEGVDAMPGVHSAVAIEAEQAREVNGEVPMGDVRDAGAEELRLRGFEEVPGQSGVRIRRL